MACFEARHGDARVVGLVVAAHAEADRKRSRALAELLRDQARDRRAVCAARKEAADLVAIETLDALRHSSAERSEKPLALDVEIEKSALVENGSPVAAHGHGAFAVAEKAFPMIETAHAPHDRE